MHQANSRRRRASPKAADLPTEIAIISTDLFPGPLELLRESDPEAPDEQFLVLTVSASGTPEELVRRRREWHRRVSESLPNVDIRLMISSTTT